MPKQAANDRSSMRTNVKQSLEMKKILAISFITALQT